VVTFAKSNPVDSMFAIRNGESLFAEIGLIAELAETEFRSAGGIRGLCATRWVFDV
jgi:hypothetical protein